MTSPRSEKPPRNPPAGNEAEGTGVPGLPTWRAVYVCLLAGFVAYVIILTVITRVYAP